MGSFRNIFAFLLLILAIIFAIVEWQGGFKPTPLSVSSSDNEKQLQNQNVEEPPLSAQQDKLDGISPIKTSSPLDLPALQTWIEHNKGKFGLLVVLILCFLGFFFTKSFFDKL